jgi:acyl-CoA synthetase (AMP-forming)/AMP-acid ligase II
MEFRSLADVPRRQAVERGESVAFQFGSRRTTFAELDRVSNRVSHALSSAGVSPGDRVGYLGKNSDVFFFVFFGCAKVGAVLTPINWRLAAPEVCFILKDARCQILFVGQEFATLAEAIGAECPSLSLFVGADEAAPGVPSFDDWLGEHVDADAGRSAARDDVVLQLYTSGTTGLPKGAELTHRNLLFATGLSRTEAFGRWRDDDICVLPLPLFHAGGVVFGLNAPCTGAMEILVREAQPGPIIEAVRASPRPITRLGVVPAVFAPLIEHPNFRASDFAALRTLTYGGAPIAPDLVSRLISIFGPVLLQLFGMTETATIGTILTPADHDPDKPERLLSCGRAAPGVEVKVVSPDESEAVAGRSGEILIRCDAVMAGYWNRANETKAALVDGWYRTGDVGYCDEDGFFYIQDRLKDMIVSGGENVYSAEVENALLRHTAVATCAVIGIPSARWGEQVHAVVVLRPGAEASDKQLRDHCHAYIAAYKCPVSIEFCGALPVTATGKLMKHALREPYWSGWKRNVS